MVRIKFEDDGRGHKVERSAKVVKKTQHLRHAQSLLFQPKPKWHDQILTPVPVSQHVAPVALSVLETVHDYAESLLQVENDRYIEQNQQSSSSYKFMTSIMSSGTWSDKVSALTLVVQESPLHSTRALENLLSLAGKKSRTQALMALAALKDLFSQGVVLPDDRKLKAFIKQPGLLAAFAGLKQWSPDDTLPGDLQPAHLVLWAFEDWLKRQYWEMLKTIESWLNDEVEVSRMRAVTYVWELLKEKPEQEENLLRLLVNKLGDATKKIASRASHLILQLQVTHPSMKGVIVSAIESEILFRPSKSPHSMYYAIITLNQTIFQTGHAEVADKLIDLYFTLFVSLLNRLDQPRPSARSRAENGGHSRRRKRNTTAPNATLPNSNHELNDKLIAQILTGVNRAFPYSSKDSLTFENHLDTVFRITHSANFNTSVQALMLIQQISSAHHISTDRYMRTLYESLLDPRLIGSSKQTLYLNLLYRSLKDDASPKRVKAFLKRILQILHLHEPPFICAVFYLLLELQKAFPSIRTMLNQPETDIGDESDKQATTAIGNENSVYDARKRDPLHASADSACLWEMYMWTLHYHPSVTLFARHLLERASGPEQAKALPPPDPLSHTLSHFLDRFAYRNPKSKANDGVKGPSLMQPALANIAGNNASYLSNRSDQTRSSNLNTEAFWNKALDSVSPDEVFFHRYFTAEHSGKNRKAKKGAEKKKKSDGPDEAVDFFDNEEERAGFEDAFDESEEEKIWQAMVDSNSQLQEPDEMDEEGFNDEEDLAAILEDEDMSDAEDSASVGSRNGDLEAEGSDPLPEATDENPVELEGEETTLFSERDSEEEKPDIDISRRGIKRQRKKTIKNLPMFASAEDYASMIVDDAGLDT